MNAKLTRNQERILDLIQNLAQSASAQTIYAELRDRHQGVGLATVYRSLEVLKRQGLIKALTLPNGEAVYSRMPIDKHHLNCVNCGASLPIDSCPVHNLNAQFDQTYNFKIYYHTLEFFGLCSQCQASQNSKSEPA